VILGKNTFEMNTAQNGQKQPKTAKMAQSGPKTPSIMSAPWQKWPNLFSCQAHLREKHYQSYFITVKNELT